MKRGVIYAVISGVAIMTLSCVERTSTLKPIDAGLPVTEKGITPPAVAGFEGTIGRINAEKGLITVDHWPLTKTFNVPPECQIDNLTNANAALTQLKVGDTVVVTYSETGKNLIANRIVRQGKEYEEERKGQMERLDDMLNPSPNQ